MIVFRKKLVDQFIVNTVINIFLRQRKKTPVMNHKDYSYINNLEDLHKEIQLVRFRATESRLRLEEKFTQLPKETLRKLGSSVTNFLFSGTRR